MDLLVKNKINFAYPMKFFLFPLIAKGIINYTKLPQLQSTVACGTLTGKYKYLPILNCSQCLVSVKYDKKSIHNKESPLDKVYRSNLWLRWFVPKDYFVRYACRTNVEDDMEVITYCDTNTNHAGKVVIGLYIMAIVAVIYACIKHLDSLKNVSNNLLQWYENRKTLQNFDDWMKEISEKKPGSNQ